MDRVSSKSRTSGSRTLQFISSSQSTISVKELSTTICHLPTIRWKWLPTEEFIRRWDAWDSRPNECNLTREILFHIQTMVDSRCRINSHLLLCVPTKTTPQTIMIMITRMMMARWIRGEKGLPAISVLISNSTRTRPMPRASINKNQLKVDYRSHWKLSNNRFDQDLISKDLWEQIFINSRTTN